MGSETTDVQSVVHSTDTEDITYNVEVKSMQYTIIGENIKKDFDFINGELVDKLDNMLKELEKGTSNSNAFYFEESTTYSDLVHVYEEIEKDVSELKKGLNDLHKAFMTNIDNVNAELDYNFGHWLFGSATEAGRVTKSNTDS